MRFSSDRSICSVSIPRCGWGSYIFPFGFLQVYFGIPLILYALFITHFDVSRPQGSAAALYGPGALTGKGCPESGRLIGHELELVSGYHSQANCINIPINY